jgi:spiro-SPASM protein
VRKRGNEDEVEAFYRYWKARGANIIVQKYDSFAGALPDLATADLSPLERHPCWHVMRDFPVLVDGRMPLCREDLAALGGLFLPNALNDGFADIWASRAPVYAEHCAADYPALCKKCDEWYTYNF